MRSSESRWMGRVERPSARTRGLGARWKLVALTRIVTHRRYTQSLQTSSLAAMGEAAKADIRERFGFAVKDRREALGLTQEEFAARAGIHRTYLSDVERGSRNLSLINIERVAEALAMKLSELFRIVEDG